MTSPTPPPATPPPPDLRAKNLVRFPAINGSALDAARLVTPQALAEIQAGEGARGAHRRSSCRRSRRCSCVARRAR